MNKPNTKSKKRSSDADISDSRSRRHNVAQQRTTHYESDQRALRLVREVERSIESSTEASSGRNEPEENVNVIEIPVPGTLDYDDADIFDSRLIELESLGLPITDISPATVRKKARTQSDHPLLGWVPFIDSYLNELLRLEGRGDLSDQSSCAGYQCNILFDSASNFGFRCEDCHDIRLFCASCFVMKHMSTPLHRPKKWNGDYFEKVTLRAMGLRIQLGHPKTNVCALPMRSHDNDFTIIHSNGVQKVYLDFCGCQQSIPKYIQLLRSKLFPSTTTDPRTAATFDVLSTFQMLNFTSKISAFEFYTSLSRRTDNTGTLEIADRYHAFLRIVREWRHLRLLKRMGRGHSGSGAGGTQEGECAVICPACPIPGVNSPPDITSIPESERWLHTLFIGLDANFRLKRLNVSTEEKDPGLNHGYAYVVEKTKFKSYLDYYDTIIPDDKSTCNNHDAIKSASMRGGKGTAASGCGTGGECIRHDMKRPVSVGDLQKGERYVNMDYFFLSSLRNAPASLVVSYDIACQWSRNIEKRCSLYPPNPISNKSVNVTYLVPKFHLPAHISQCQIDYSFNLVPGVGRTDGEAPERGWADANKIASSTKEMGPGSRRDTLDDHFGDYNWRKITGLADSLLRKAQEAIACRQEHVDAFLEFNAALPNALTSSWTELCLSWEADRSKKNPFFNERSVITDAQVRLRLANEDAKDLAEARTSDSSRAQLHDEVSPSMLIYQGLEFEEQQRRLTSDIAQLGSSPTALAQAKIIERSNSLRRRIEAWFDIQKLYMPSVALLRARSDREGGGTPCAVQDLDLCLPSQIYGLAACEIRLLRHEFDLRMSHAENTLSDLRGLLLMRSQMWKSKDRFSRGQRMNLRSQALIENVSRRIREMAQKYRTIRAAIAVISSPLLESKWTTTLRELHESDLEGLTSMDSDGGEGRKKLKWIWTVQGYEDSGDSQTNDALRIEWCKARARAHRWQEECLLLNEEMSRVIRTFRYQSNEWLARANTYTDENISTQQTIPQLAQAEVRSTKILFQGKRGYALQQRARCNAMAAHCICKWIGLPAELIRMSDRDARVLVESVVEASESSA